MFVDGLMTVYSIAGSLPFNQALMNDIFDCLSALNCLEIVDPY